MELYSAMGDRSRIGVRSQSRLSIEVRGEGGAGSSVRWTPGTMACESAIVCEHQVGKWLDEKSRARSSSSSAAAARRWASLSDDWSAGGGGTTSISSSSFAMATSQSDESLTGVRARSTISRAKASAPYPPTPLLRLLPHFHVSRPHAHRPAQIFVSEGVNSLFGRRALAHPSHANSHFHFHRLLQAMFETRWNPQPLKRSSFL